MHIGELARAASVNIQTIRFYEREDLLRVPSRTASGYRCYDEKDVERVRFIRRTQDLGFTLAEIRQLISLHIALASLPKSFKRKPNEILRIMDLARERLLVIEQKIRLLRSMRSQLSSVLQQLGAATEVMCPVASGASKQSSKPS